MKIRPQTNAEDAAIRDVIQAAFGRAEEAELVENIRKTDDYRQELSLVAESSDGSIVGHALFSQVVLEMEEKTRILLALAPVAVLPSEQNRGYGSALIEEGIRLSREKSYPGIVVLGHETYYPRFGFEPSSKYGIKPPFEVPEANFMILELYPESLKRQEGTIIYPASFQGV